MPTITILSATTQGVDLRTNPLFLGDKKLRSATNLVFEEGVIRTRHGFVHQSIGLKGQFQGACLYAPSRGISSGVFGADTESLALVVDGQLYNFVDGCATASSTGEPFHCKGDVHLFQAENYLIVQNPETKTFWWDGNTLYESPGLNEEWWDEPVLQRDEQEIIKPVANIPDCYPDTTYTLTFVVVDKDTDLPIPGASVTLKRWSTAKYYGTTKADGKCSWVAPMKKELRYSVTKAGYYPATDVSFTVTGLDQTVIVPLGQPPLSCDYTVTTDFDSEDFDWGKVLITAGETALNVIAINVYDSSPANPIPGDWTFDTLGGGPVTLPYLMEAAASDTLVFAPSVSGALDGATVQVITSCSDSDPLPFQWGDGPEDPPPPPIEICDYTTAVVSQTPVTPEVSVYTTVIDVANTGDLPLEITGVSSQDAFTFLGITNPVPLPLTVAVGATMRVTVSVSVIGSIAGFGFTLATDCGPTNFAWPDAECSYMTSLPILSEGDPWPAPYNPTPGSIAVEGYGMVIEVINTGTAPLVVEGVTLVSSPVMILQLDILQFSPAFAALPVTIAPGNAAQFRVTVVPGEEGGISGLEFTLDTDCGPTTFIWPS